MKTNAQQFAETVILVAVLFLAAYFFFTRAEIDYCNITDSGSVNCTLEEWYEFENNMDQTYGEGAWGCEIWYHSNDVVYAEWCVYARQDCFFVWCWPME